VSILTDTEKGERWKNKEEKENKRQRGKEKKEEGRTLDVLVVTPFAS
jgi:hypothetical protein